MAVVATAVWVGVVVLAVVLARRIVHLRGVLAESRRRRVGPTS